MSDPEAVVARCDPLARRLLIAMTVVFALLGLVYHRPDFPRLRVPLAFVIPPAAAYGLALAVALARRGPAGLPPVPFVAGGLLTAVGIWADVLATVIHTPR